MRVRFPRLSSAWPSLALVLLLACGDDEPGAKDAGADAGATGPLRLDAGGKFSDATTPGEPGFPCGTDEECGGELSCVGNALPGSNALFGFCGKRCTSGDDCGTDEGCVTNTGRQEDLHCVAFEHEEYGLCGPLVATVCDGRSCLLAPDVPVGFCIDICSLDADAAADAGVDDGEDAGVDGALVCRAGKTCIGGVLNSTSEGLCGQYVERGESCATNKGRFCGDDDVCAWSDPEDSGSELRCYQSCASRSAVCAEGSCVIVSGTAYCL